MEEAEFSLSICHCVSVLYCFSMVLGRDKGGLSCFSLAIQFQSSAYHTFFHFLSNNDFSSFVERLIRRLYKHSSNS